MNNSTHKSSLILYKKLIFIIYLYSLHFTWFSIEEL